MDILQTVITIGSLAAAILAWYAKLRWSKEFEKAKTETIKAKDAQIALLEREIKSLQDMTPMKVREYSNSVKEQLEEYNEELKKQLEAVQIENNTLYEKLNVNVDAENLDLPQDSERLKFLAEKLRSLSSEATESGNKIAAAVKAAEKISVFLKTQWI